MFRCVFSDLVKLGAPPRVRREGRNHPYLADDMHPIISLSIVHARIDFALRNSATAGNKLTLPGNLETVSNCRWSHTLAHRCIVGTTELLIDRTASRFYGEDEGAASTSLYSAQRRANIRSKGELVGIHFEMGYTGDTWQLMFDARILQHRSQLTNAISTGNSCQYALT